MIGRISLSPGSAVATTPSAIADASVLREAERGEWLVARMRVALTTVAFVFLFVTHGIPVLRGTAPRDEGLIPLLLTPSLVLAWAWLPLLRRIRYRRAVSRVSALLDAVIAGAFALAEVELRGSPTADKFAVGALPPLLVLFFLLAAAGVRQDPVSCVLTGGVSMAMTAATVLRAAHHARLATVAPALAPEAAAGPWFGRALIFSFTMAMVALAARNARRMARDSGVAVAEQDKVVALFGRYVDPGIARDVLAGTPDAAESREATVVFTDLRGFTALSETLEPAAVLALLNAHYGAIVPAVHAHGGTVNKFIGDAIMATFGAPIPHSDHARRAVRAALAMLEAMDKLNERHRGEGLPELQMGVGIATGTVVVGSLGAAERVEYAVIGDTVNTASRLEGLNKELGTRILLTRETRDAVGDAVPTRSMGDVAVRGKALPLEVFTPCAEAARGSTERST